MFKNGVHIHYMGGHWNFSLYILQRAGFHSLYSEFNQRGVNNEHWLWLCHPVVFNHPIGPWFPASNFPLGWWLRKKSCLFLFVESLNAWNTQKKNSCKKHKPDTFHLILCSPDLTPPNRHLFNSSWIQLIHPREPTYPLNRHFKRNIILQPSSFRGHVSFWGCIYLCIYIYITDIIP